MHSRGRLLRNAVIGSVVGSTAGAAVGLWSVQHRLPKVTPPGHEPIGIVGIASSSPSRGETDEDVVTERDLPLFDGPEVSELARPKAVAGDAQSILRRARILAQRPDVARLLDLRDGVSRAAEGRGEKQSAATRRLLNELDRDLAQARLLRLKLDAAELRKTARANRAR